MQLELFVFDKLKRRFKTALRALKPPAAATRNSRTVKSRLLVNARSDLLLDSILKELINEFFPDNNNLLDYKIYWSQRRQKRTLASCNIRSRRINVARELNHLDHHKWLRPLIYHELCHAVIGKDKSSARCWHGRAFRELENKHPLMHEFNHWVKTGGWRKAVMSERKRSWWQEKKIPKDGP